MRTATGGDCRRGDEDPERELQIQPEEEEDVGESYFFFGPDPLTKRLASNGWGGTGRNFRPVRRRLALPKKKLALCCQEKPLEVE